MKRPSWTQFITLAAIAVGWLTTGPAHAFSKTIGLTSNKYAKAWVDMSANTCTSSNGAVPACWKANASVSGNLLNAPINAVSGEATAYKVVAPDASWWLWRYSVSIFGTSIASAGGGIKEQDALMNVAVGQPVIDQTSPLVTRGVKNLSLDLGEIHSLLGILPDASITITYSLDAGVTTKMDVFPKSGYGAFVNARVRPHGGMTASGFSSYKLAVVEATVSTPSNIQVVAPGSEVALDASYSFNTKNIELTLTPKVQLLKGRVAYKIDGWMNPAGLLVDAASTATCIFSIGFICPDTSYAWGTYASGSIWSSPNSYAFSLTTPSTLYSGVLDPS